MTDLELRLLHCEREPSEVALYDAADVYREMDDLEMYHGLKYMADNKKMPWRSDRNKPTQYLWACARFKDSFAIGRPIFQTFFQQSLLVLERRTKYLNYSSIPSVGSVSVLLS
jgi:hypothetical protein